MITNKMYCYVGDLLGFQDTILNLPEEEQKERVDEWIRIIEDCAGRRNHITKKHYVSDTIFIGAEGDKDGLDDLLVFSRDLMEKGIRNSFLVRGAITFGKVQWESPVTFGDAVVRAYNLANNQSWIGTACESGLQEINLLWDFDKVFVYPPPLKRGKIELLPVVSWNVPLTRDICRMAIDRGLTRRGEELTWEKYGHKIINTALFSIYLKKIRDIQTKQLPPQPKPSSFYGFLPTELAEFDITNQFIKQTN